jgi:hypothetical protein
MKNQAKKLLTEMLDVIKVAHFSFVSIGALGASIVALQLLPDAPKFLVFTCGCIIGSIVGAYASKEATK